MLGDHKVCSGTVKKKNGTVDLSKVCQYKSVYIYFIVDTVACVVISNTLLRAGCYFDQSYGTSVAAMF